MVLDGGQSLRRRRGRQDDRESIRPALGRLGAQSIFERGAARGSDSDAAGHDRPALRIEARAPPRQSCSPTTGSHARRWLTPVRAGLAAIERASLNTEGRAIVAGRVRITAAGRTALED